ncbi:17131_t:CDS:2, partial [Funneliformis geosporum]
QNEIQIVFDKRMNEVEEAIPIISLNSKHGTNSRKNYEENLVALRYVWYYENPYIVIPEHLRDLNRVKTLNAFVFR